MPRLVSLIIVTSDGNSDIIKMLPDAKYDVGNSQSASVLEYELIYALSGLTSSDRNTEEEILLPFISAIADGAYYARVGGTDIHLYKLITSCCKFASYILKSCAGDRHVWREHELKLINVINAASCAGVGLDCIYECSPSELLELNI